nr:MAG TPA: nucleoside triphosphate pyrophosphohydrolase [Caudoviricetes sp.]
MTSKEIMQLAIGSYGRVNQVIKTVEELSELSQALCKILTSKFTDDNTEIFENIFEEMADVEIMLEQCKMIFYKSEDKINDYKKKKIERLERRLEGEN